MRHQFRLLRILKWAGTALCVLIATAFAASVFWKFSYESSASPRVLVTLHTGLVSCVWRHLYGDSWQGGWRIEKTGRTRMQGALWPTSFVERARDATLLRVPLAVLFAAALLPTLLFWFLDRRRPPPGHCGRCGYNLAGNTTGRCPECGTTVFTPKRAALD